MDLTVAYVATYVAYAEAATYAATYAATADAKHNLNKSIAKYGMKLLKKSRVSTTKL